MHWPRWRLMSWVIIVWIALALFAVFQFAARDQACRDKAGFDRQQCEVDARQGFRGAVGWLVIGTIGFGVIWIVTQPRHGGNDLPDPPPDAEPPAVHPKE